MKKKLAAAAAVMTALFSMTGCATTADGAATGTNGATSLIMIVGYMVIIIGVMYAAGIRPVEKKEQKKQSQMLSALEVGDIVLTTSGFYGTVIDITDDTVIVEFGNNKNCRIPMQKSAIVEAEKPDAE